MADGYLERPSRLLEKVISLCRIEYEHTFAIVDFGKRTNFEIILGRPFMRQLKMIQDWGYNHLYLRQMNVVTRINLKDHSYRDVTKTPVEEFDSTTTKGIGSFSMVEWRHSPVDVRSFRMWKSKKRGL